MRTDSYPSDVTDAEWESLVPYSVLMREDAPQREHDLREAFNALRYVVKTGCPWRFLPHDFPPWTAVYQQARRWLDNGVFEQVAHDLRAIVRVLAERQPDPSAVIFDARTIQSTLESGGSERLQRNSSLSTPTTATWSGTARPTRRLASSTWRARMS